MENTLCLFFFFEANTLRKIKWLINVHSRLPAAGKVGDPERDGVSKLALIGLSSSVPSMISDIVAVR